MSLRGALYYFHELAKPFPPDSMGSIYHILENGTMVELGIEKPFLNEFTNDDNLQYNIDQIQLAPFSRRFYKNVRVDNITFEYKTKV